MFSLFLAFLIGGSLTAASDLLDDGLDESGLNFDDNIDGDIPVVEGFGGDLKVDVDENVIVLTNENYHRIVLSKPFILVEFYAPWCGHCKALAPEYATAASILKDADPPVALAKVDATVENELAKAFEIKGLPTMFYYIKGEKHEYDGPRDADGIVAYMKEKTDPNWKPPKETVITLTKENFTQIVDQEDLILVEFYAPWCGHCKSLAPKYEQASKKLQKLPKRIKLAKVNADVETDLKTQYNITGFPTLVVFRKGKRYEYKGERDTKGIVEYMKKQLEPPSTLLTSTKLLDKAVKVRGTSVQPIVLGVLDTEVSVAYDTYIDAAHEYRDKGYAFFHVFDKNLMKELNESPNSVVVLQPEIFRSEYEPVAKRLTLRDSTTTQYILDFIHKNTLPLVGWRNYQNAWLFQKKYPIVVVYCDVDFGYENIGETQIIRKKVLKVANEYKGRVYFALSSESEFDSELKDFGLDDSGADVNVGMFKAQSERYAMDADDGFSSEDLSRFVDDVLAGKVQRKIKSQREPTPNDGPIKEVVGSSFQKLVTDSPTNVVMHFYGEWCVTCKDVEKIFDELANKYADKSDVVTFAKLDITHNDFPASYVVTDVPKIYYVPKGGKSEPQSYGGEYNLEELSSFIEGKLSEVSAQKEEL